MKNCIFVCLAALTFLYHGCKQGTPVSPETIQLYGSWQWVRTVGGFGGEIRTPQSTGRTATTVFRADGSVQFFQDNVLVDQRRYVLSREKPSPSASEALLVEFVGLRAPTNKKAVAFEGLDTLLLSDLCMDCYQDTYVRNRQ